MLNGVSRARLVMLAFGLIAGFAGLLVWLAEIQLRQHEPLRRLASANLQQQVLRPARRGAITDSRGTVLAVSVPTKTVCADPSLIYTRHGLIAATLAPILELPEVELRAKLAPRLRTNELGEVLTNSYVLLKRKVPLERWQQVTQAMAHLDLGVTEKKPRSTVRFAMQALRTRAIFGVDDHVRHYPSGSMAAHLLGFTASGEAETDHGSLFEDHGVTGLELTFDDELTGVHGWRRRGEDLGARDGLTVVLTLDATIQHIVEEELEAAVAKYAPAGASALVVRPRTGEILALANCPTFDPNRPGGGGVSGQRNLAISGLYEPGSTFKIITIATALNDRKLSLEETIHCENGRWRYQKTYLHDHHPYGILSFEKVVAKSSNIGTAKAALRLGPERLHHTITNFGFGRRTGLPLPGEAVGVVYHPRSWSGISITRIPIGHEVQATPLQMVMAMAALANGGVLMQPRLVDRLEDPEGRVVRVFPTNALRRVVQERACQEMTRALQVAASEEGTASAAQLEHYRVAGKTGTAEKFANGTYKSGKYFSSFIGFFPLDRPELCMLVAIDEPDRRIGHMGGKVAAPVFRAIGERVANYLRLPPDLVPEGDGELRERRVAPRGDLIVRRAEGTSALGHTNAPVVR